MISMGMAVRIRIGPLPYWVATASAASDSPTVAAGADEAIPMTVSWATPIASGSSRAACTRGGSDTGAVVYSAITSPIGPPSGMAPGTALGPDCWRDHSGHMCPDNMPAAIFWAFAVSRLIADIDVFPPFPGGGPETVTATAVTAVGRTDGDQPGPGTTSGPPLAFRGAPP